MHIESLMKWTGWKTRKITESDMFNRSTSITPSNPPSHWRYSVLFIQNKRMELIKNEWWNLRLPKNFPLLIFFLQYFIELLHRRKRISSSSRINSHREGLQASQKAYIPLGLYNSSCPLLICYRTNRRGGGNTRGRCEGKRGDRYCGPPGARVTYARVNWSASPTSFCTKSCSGNAVTFLCAAPFPVCVLKKENRGVPRSIVTPASRFSTKKQLRINWKIQRTGKME